jgi:hypothetical protein
MNPPLLGSKSAIGTGTGPSRSMCWTLESEKMDTGVEDASPEHCSRADRGVARNPLSETH